MAKSRATLLEELNASVRSAGQGGLTTAQNLRTFLTSLIDEILDRTRSMNAVLEFVFQAQFTDAIDRTIGVNQASEYQTQQLQNVAEVIYQVNEEMVKLPFTTAVGDTLRISIKRSNPELGAVVILRNE